MTRARYNVAERKMSESFDAAGETQGARASTIFRAREMLMGVAVVFESNAEEVLDAVSAWLGRRDAAVSAPLTSPATPRVRLMLHAAGEIDADGQLAFSTPLPHVLEIAGPGFRGEADAAALTASCTLAPAVLGSRERFEETVVASLTLFLVTRLDRQPFHAAALAADGRAVLLSGPSGSGKSTLAYAALSTGWTVLSDDAVYLQSKPVAGLWARPGRLHVPPDAARWFPELGGLEPVLRENGKWRIPIERIVSRAWVQPRERATLCILERGQDTASCERIDAASAIAALVRDVEPGFDAFRDTIGTVLHSLVDETLLVRTGGDPRAVVTLLRERLWPDGQEPTRRP